MKQEKFNNTTKSIVYNALRALVNDNKAVTMLDAASWSASIALKYGRNLNTVDRARRKYIAEQLASDLEARENKAFSEVLNTFKQG